MGRSTPLPRLRCKNMIFCGRYLQLSGHRKKAHNLHDVCSHIGFPSQVHRQHHLICWEKDWMQRPLIAFLPLVICSYECNWMDFQDKPISFQFVDLRLAYSIGIGHASVRHAHLIASAYDSDLLGHLGSILSKQKVQWSTWTVWG